MSRFLTRLVDRAIGTASAIEPVRSPVFMDASSDSSKLTGHEDVRFAYGDLVRSTQVLPQQTQIDVDGIADSISRNDKEENTSVQPLDSRRANAIPVPDVSESVTQGLTRQNQGYDVTVSHTRETAKNAVQTEAVTTEPGTLATELVPMTSRSAQKIKEQPINHSVNQHVHSHTSGNTRQSVQMDAGERELKPSNSLMHANSDSLLRSRVSPTSSLRSSSTQQVIINNLMQQKAQPQAPQPPTIQVTIGRIEVRAVTTPPASQASQPRKKPKPSLSLDDYLKQRSGDQR